MLCKSGCVEESDVLAILSIWRGDFVSVSFARSASVRLMQETQVKPISSGTCHRKCITMYLGKFSGSWDALAYSKLLLEHCKRDRNSELMITADKQR